MGFSIIIMGNSACQCQRNQVSNSQGYLSSTLRNDDYNKPTSQQLTQLIQEQYDNPSRNRLNQNFLKTAINASNNLLILTPKPSTTSLRPIKASKTSEKIVSLIRMDQEIAHSHKVEDRETQDEINEKSQQERKNMLNQTRKRKLSIESKIEVKKNIQEKDESLQVGSTPQILRSISEYILSEKNLFEPIQLSKQNFVRFKHQNIHQHYIFIQKVGEGTFGIVYKVKNRCSGQIRAAKILKKSKINPEQSAKLMNQINILRKLDHPNIIKIYEVYIYENIYCIITEYCEGGSLFKVMKEGRHYSEEVIRTIVKKIMSALSYMHKLNIIHRDIKLDNIVFVNKIEREGDFNHLDIRLIDFGLAKVISMKRIKDREKIGTYTHMAPQVLKGVYSPQCDIWSVGIAIFLMVSGGLNPFKKGTKEQTYDSILNDTLRFQGQMWRKVSVHLKNFLIKLLNKNMNQRINAIQALSHPFVKISKLDGSQKQILERAAKKFCDYNRGNNFVSMIESYLSYTATSARKQRECSQMFQAFDANCDGYIQRQQLYNAFEKSGITLSEGQMEYLLGKVDKNNSGKIDYSEFVTIVSDRKKLFTKQSLISAFKYLDVNCNGFLDRDELRNALKSTNCKQLNNILHELDMNNDDKISQQQFISYLQNQQCVRQ